jgi:hypothetical protein
VATIINTIHALAPNATIYFADYPRLLGTQPSAGQTNCIVGVAHVHTPIGTIDDNLFLAESDIAWIDRAGAMLDNTIMTQVRIQQAKGLPVVPVEIRPLSAGHGLCDTLGPWVNPVTVDADTSGSYVLDPGSFHPTIPGQNSYVTAFKSAGIH